MNETLSETQALEPNPLYSNLTHFEARIDAGEKIEPGDWMPDEYRRQLIRMISQHAHSEVVGCCPKGNGLPKRRR